MKIYVKLVVDLQFCFVQCIGGWSVFRREYFWWQRSRRPVEVTDKFHIEKVKERLNEDRRYTCDELAERIDISHGSVYTISTRHLKVRQIAARWVPKHLTWAQMTDRVETAKRQLIRYENEGNHCFNRIVAIDETWLRNYEPELKSQSSEWHTRNRQDRRNFVEREF